MRAPTRAGKAAAASLAAAAVLLGSVGTVAAASLRPQASAAHLPTNGAALVGVTSRPSPRLLGRVASLGAVPASQMLTGLVAMKLRDESGLAQFIAAASEPTSGAYGHYLTPIGFARRFGPAPSTLAQVERLLTSKGLVVTAVSRNGLLVRFAGRAATVERAFHTGIDRYRLPDGSLGYGTTAPVELPAAVARSVTAVAGLDDLVRYDSNLFRRPKSEVPIASRRRPLPSKIAGAPSACRSAASQGEYGSITDDQLAHSYGADGLYAAGDLGSGQTVDIFELEPFFRSDIRAFDECYFGADHTSQVMGIPVDGGTGTGEGSGEAALDIENVSAIAPAAHIDVYEAPNTTVGSLDDYNAMVLADNARVISTSWGLCETALQAGAPGTQQIENSIFMEAAAQGQSVFAAAGDDGSDDCAEQGSSPVAPVLSVDDPESQPYVVSAGGSTFLDTSEPPDEIVWNDGATGGAGGGGVSDTWAMPTWQEDSGVPGVTDNPYTAYATHLDGVRSYQSCSNDATGVADDEHLAGSPTTLPAGTLCREVPDVTALADEDTGITVYFSGWTAFGGTSASAPFWAAMTADMNASRFCGGSTDGVGFLSPLLYEIAGNRTNYADAFNDISVGNNDSLGVGTDLPLGASGNTYKASAGYDLASGLGSPRLTNADGAPGLAELACEAGDSKTRPAVTGINPPYGSAAGGTSVAILGTGFGSTPGDVQFGDIRVPPSDIKSWSCSSSPCVITLDTPALYQAPASDGPPGGVVAVTVRTAGTSGEVSAPGPSGAFHYLDAVSGTNPVVEYVAPAGGPDAGGTLVHVIGSGFENGSVTGVTLGGISGGDVKVLSDDELTVRTPPDAGASCAAGSGDKTTGACQVQVVVTTTMGTSPTSSILPALEGPITMSPLGVLVPPPGCGCEVVPAMTEFDYSPPPTVTSVVPSFGSALGGTIETVDGSGFNILTYDWTNFGPPTNDASQDLQLDAISNHSLQVTALPIAFSPSEVGTQPVPTGVSVQTLAGLGRNGPASSFAYAGIPVVTAISHPYGPTTGGQKLTITGKGFSDATSVEIVSRIPSPFGTQFSAVYLSAPPASNISLTITTPADSPGPNDVEVCSATACSTARPAHDAYVYAYPGTPIVLSSAPTTGPAKGGTKVTIHGFLLSGVRAVYFGDRRAKSWRSGPSQAPEGSSTEIIAVAPAGKAGEKVFITVLTDGSSLPSARSDRATFTYKAR